MLGECRSGLEVLEFWEVFVRVCTEDLAILALLELPAFSESASLVFFNTDGGFDSRRLHHT